MMLYVVALYGVPVVLALVTLWIGALGLKFYWDEVVHSRSGTESP